MILLMNVWTLGNHFWNCPEWATVSLDNKRIQLYLDRINQARIMHEKEGAAFNCIEYWDNLPVWTGECEVWNDLYPESIQIIGHLQASNEQGQFFHTECTMLVVTPDGVSWKTTMKSSPGTAGTEEVSKALLLELRLRQGLERAETGQCQRYPERP